MSKAKTKTKVQPVPTLTKSAVIVAMAFIGIVAFLIRVIPAYHNVFGDGFVNFLEGDAYNRMLYARQIHDMSFGAGFLLIVKNSLLMSGIIAALGHIGNMELVGAWLPPIMAVGAVVVVYFIARTIFNKYIGLLSALFVAIIPSEFLHRSLLGYPDHHVLEVLLMLLVIWFLIRTMKEPKAVNRWGIGAGIMLFLYMANWTGGILMPAIMVLTTIIIIIKDNIKREDWFPDVLKILFPVAVGMAIYLPLGGFVRYFWWIPGLQGSNAVTAASITASQHAGQIFAPISERTTAELMPLLMPGGSFNPMVVITNLNIFAMTFIIGLIMLWKKQTDKIRLFVLIWTIVLLIATLNERRFLYYLTLPIGILSAWAIAEIAQKVRVSRQTLVSWAMVLPLIMLSLPMAQVVSGSGSYRMPPEWHQDLQWLAKQPDLGYVTAWSDYGHWIQYETGMTANLLPGPGGADVATLMLTSKDDVAKQLLKKLDTGYLIIDKATTQGKVEALQKTAGMYATTNSLMFRLARGDSVDYLKLVLESPTIKIYEVEL